MLRVKHAFQSTQAAIDLASIMVGIVVIGIIGGVISATVFAVIPWAQDNAAKAQLAEVQIAEEAHAGFASEKAAPLYGAKAALEGGGLLPSIPDLCVEVGSQADTYRAVIKSKTGNIFEVTSERKSPKLLESTNSAAVSCFAGGAEAGSDLRTFYSGVVPKHDQDWAEVAVAVRGESQWSVDCEQTKLAFEEVASPSSFFSCSTEQVTATYAPGSKTNHEFSLYIEAAPTNSCDTPDSDFIVSASVFVNEAGTKGKQALVLEAPHRIC